MGSLVPGWDAASSVPPKDLQEFNETEQPVGYFAKLEHTKSLKRTSVDTYHAGASQPMLQPIPSLQRAASLHQGTAVPMPSSATHVPAQRHPLSSSLGTSSIMMHHPSTSPRAFKPTDWESEFKSLGSIKRTSVGPFARTSGEQADSGRSSAEHHATTATAQPHWWAHMDSGLLNRGEGADAEAAAVGSTAMKDLRGSFKLDVPTTINLH